MSIQFPLGATIINCLMALIYIGLAAATNKFLLKRLDALAEEAEYEALQAALRANSRYNYTGRHIQRSSIRSMDTRHDSTSVTGPFKQQRDSGLSQPAPGNASDSAASRAKAARAQVRQAMLHDYVSMFFILIVFFALTRAITVMTSTMMESHQVLQFGKSRRTQDLLFFPSSILYYVLTAVLLHTFHYMSDAGAPKSLFVYRLRLGLGLGALIGSGVVCLGLVLTEVFVLAVEYATVVYGFVLSVLYFITALYIPRKVLEYGEALADLARRVKRVSFLMCFSLCARSVLLIPQMQQFYGSSLGTYAVCVSMPFDLIPTLVAVWMLQR